MAEKTLNTIIVLKNDTKANWEKVKDTATLRVGELGIESDTGLFKIGAEAVKDGETTPVLLTWGELPYANEIPDVDLSTVTNDVQVVDGSVEDLEDGRVVGDMAIVRSTINGNIKSHTAYVWNGEAWAAMDGNYNASNVYFDKNIQVTQSVGNVTTSNNAPVDLAFAGKNMEQIWQYLYATEDTKIAIDGASASISLSKTSDSLEVGTAYTLPTASVSTSSGKYKEYGGKDDKGNKVANNVNLSDVTFDLTLKYTRPGETTSIELATATAATSIAATTVPEANRPTEMIAEANSITHTFSGTFKNTASAYKPVTNLGNFVTKLNSGSAQATSDYASGAVGVAARTEAANMTAKTYTVSGFRKWYRGGDNKTDFSVATIKGLTASDGAVSAQTFELKAASYAGCSRIVIAIPAAANIKVKEVLLKSSSNADITGEFKQVNTTENVINIGGVDNHSPVAHNVWEYKPASLDSTEVYTITIG